VQKTRLRPEDSTDLPAPVFRKLSAAEDLRITRLTPAKSQSPILKAEFFRNGLRLAVLVVLSFHDLSNLLTSTGLDAADAEEAVRVLATSPSIALKLRA
jgi:hypothetical protein